jgi:hypothetical protein
MVKKINIEIKSMLVVGRKSARIAEIAAQKQKVKEIKKLETKKLKTQDPNINAVHVVYLLRHVDCYKRADSNARIISVHEQLKPALIKCIDHNICDYLERELDAKAIPYLELTEAEIDDVKNKFVMAKVEKMSDTKLNEVHHYLVDCLLGRQGEFTMMASQNLYLLSTQNVV